MTRRSPARSVLPRILLAAIAAWTAAGVVLASSFSICFEGWLWLVFCGFVLSCAWLASLFVAATPGRRDAVRWIRAAWPIGVGAVALLQATGAPLAVRVLLDEEELSRRADSALGTWASDGRSAFVILGEGLVGEPTGVVRVPLGEVPPSRWEGLTVRSRHLVGEWWFFETFS